MRGVNKVIIVGNLGADPETRSFANGGMVCNISVATSEQWTDKQTGERREATEWHRIQFSNRLAEIAAQYLRKGSPVYVEGSLRTRKWQDQNGQDRYTTEIRAMNMQMLGSNPNAMGGMGGGMANGMGGQPMHGQMNNNYGGQGQGGYQNGYQAPQQNNFAQNNQANNFNQGQPAQANPSQPNQGFNQAAPMPAANNQPATQNPQDIAVSDGPVDDDIPF